MTIPQVANMMSIPIGIICLLISIRAFYIYTLSFNDMIFVLALSMAFLTIGTFVGTIGDAHIAGNTWNVDWTRTCGACCGGIFIFLSSLATSSQQMRKIRQWQVMVAILFVIVIVLTPFYPSAKTPPLPLVLNSLRILIYSCAFIRYALLYNSKSTRFSSMMCIAFLVLVTGYVLNIPGILQSSLAIFTIIAAAVRMSAYVTLLAAYSVK